MVGDRGTKDGDIATRCSSCCYRAERTPAFRLVVKLCDVQSLTNQIEGMLHPHILITFIIVMLRKHLRDPLPAALHLPKETTDLALNML